MKRIFSINNNFLKIFPIGCSGLLGDPGISAAHIERVWKWMIMMRIFRSRGRVEHIDEDETEGDEKNNSGRDDVL